MCMYKYGIINKIIIKQLNPTKIPVNIDNFELKHFKYFKSNN